jgi:hypothetical protein
MGPHILAISGSRRAQRPRPGGRGHRSGPRADRDQGGRPGELAAAPAGPRTGAIRRPRRHDHPAAQPGPARRPSASAGNDHRPGCRPPRARYDLFSYAVVDAYASSFTRAGYGDAIQAIRAAHLAGDRAGALAAIPDEMVDAIDATGDEALVRDTISAYQRAGVDIPVVFPLTWGAAGQDGLESTLRAAIAPPAPAAHGT